MPSHPDRLKTKGIDVTTGSLGQGISIASGIAKAIKIQKKSNKVYCIIGDGESQEGQVWEALQFIVHNNLNNMIVFLDYNKKQLDGDILDICNPIDFESKARSFGFSAITVNGSDINKLKEILSKTYEKPLFIVLDTIKGQGVEYIEKLESNHHIRLNDEIKKILDCEISRLESELI